MDVAGSLTDDLQELNLDRPTKALKVRDLVSNGTFSLFRFCKKDRFKRLFVFIRSFDFQSTEELERLTVDEKLTDIERAVYLLR